MTVGALDLWVVYGFLFTSIYFEVFLLVSFFERRFLKANAPVKSAPLPRVAIVVPCFNEEKTLAGTLGSLLKLDYPSHLLEIIVVDDGSTDDTLAIAKGFESEMVRVFHKKNGGKHTAMNFALKRTDAELIGCLDADSIVEQKALTTIVSQFANEKVAAATPGIHVKEPRGMLQHMQKVEYRLALFNRYVLSSIGSAFITPGPFSIFRADVVRTLGGWKHGHSTEDMEMALRMQAAGYWIANVPGAIVHTNTPRTVRALFRQRVRWTYGWLLNAVDYRYMFGNRQFGNLGLIILPSAILSIFAGIYFFLRIVYFSTDTLIHTILRIQATGIYPSAHFDLFYVDTSTIWFLIYLAVLLVLALLSAGTSIGTEKRLPPAATPLFILFYSFLVPLWLGAALVRATLRTGVRWR